MITSHRPAFLPLLPTSLLLLLQYKDHKSPPIRNRQGDRSLKTE